MQHLHLSTTHGAVKKTTRTPREQQLIRYTITAQGRAFLRQLRIEEKAVHASLNADIAAGVSTAVLGGNDSARGQH